tara:strand:- start:87 stop:371 length:285 start_codon:yes stop_codon:yes gene_type:complete
MNQFEEIQKESLSEIYFNSKDVLKGKYKKFIRSRNLYAATVMGNGFKRKVKILFHAMGKKLFLHTTVWFYDGDIVAFKGGKFIPVSSIESVNFY